MEKEKYQKIMELIKDVDECSATTNRRNMILLMFKNSFFENEDSLENHESWLEKEEIKLNIIIQLLLLLLHFLNIA